MQTVIDIGGHQIWQYVKPINELIKEVPKSRPGKINRKWPAARSPLTAAQQNSYSGLGHAILVATVSKNFKINLEGQNYVHFYVILSRNVKIFGIMASL